MVYIIFYFNFQLYKKLIYCNGDWEQMYDARIDTIEDKVLLEVRDRS